MSEDSTAQVTFFNKHC